MITANAGMKPPILLEVGSMGLFNYALYENRVSPVRGIQITNNTDRIVTGLTLKVSTDSGFFGDCLMPLPPLPVGKTTPIPDPWLVIDGQKLAEVTEAFTINVSVELLEGDKAAFTVLGQMKILAYDQWLGHDWIHLLPAFVTPNHPVVLGLIHDASDVLKKWGRDCALEGYQTPDPNRIRDFAAAVYTAVQNKNISYANPPAGAGVVGVGQRIRTPETIMEQHLATCMDFTMLYASCLEAIGLNPVLCLIKGHIFAGVWLADKCFDDVCTLDNGVAIKAMATGNETISFVECTRMQSGSTDSYQTAEYKPEHPNFDKPPFECLIDVQAARQLGTRPIASRYVINGHFKIDVPERNDAEMSSAPIHKNIQIAPEVSPIRPKAITNKKELWENKLLDLSGNNILLNLPYNSSVEPVMSVRLDGLFAALSGGDEFQLHPVPEQILNLGVVVEDEKGNKKDMPWLGLALGVCGGPYEMTNWIANPEHDYTGFLHREYQSRRLYSFRDPKTLDRVLTGIYRAAQSSQQENGVSSLYMAFGLLRWLDDDHKPHYAPLLLAPIEMIRKSANKGFALHMRDEEPHINLTLLEMLRQNYNIEIGGLEHLPTNEHGVDIRKVFAIVRAALMEIGHWDVVETCAIGNFSFAQFAMWNDLRQSEGLLDQNKLIRSLMQGYMDWKPAKQDASDDIQTYLPISVDDSQLQAIRMANAGETFVLHGPPGTGKSQTITAMIANLAAHGKRVLFVAEKMAALSVVEKRLTAIGLQDFCMELHSDKVNKKHVLGQLERALNRSTMWRDDDYDETLQEVTQSKADIDTYSRHLHHIHQCGLSVHELIDRYAQVASAHRYIPFSGEAAARFTREQLNRHPKLIENLIAAGKTVGAIKDHPFASIALDTLAPMTPRILREYLRMVTGHTEELIRMGESLSPAYGIEPPTTIADYRKVSESLAWWKSIAKDVPITRIFISANTDNVRDMIEHRLAIQKAEEKQLLVWRPDFLKGDIQAWVSKIETARKKFFTGKSALKTIFTELQYHACKPITQENMANYCKEAIDYQKANEDYLAHVAALSDADRALFEAISTIPQLEDAASLVQSIRETASHYPGGFEHALDMAEKDTLADDLERYQAALTAWQLSQDRLNEFLHRVPASDDAALADELAFAGRLGQAQSYLKDWTHYNRTKNECMDAGLSPVVQAYEAGMSGDELLISYRKGLYYALIVQILSHDEVLSIFSGASFNHTIERFKQLDELLLRQAQREIVMILNQKAQDVSFDIRLGAEVPFLRKAISSSARGLSIRQLFERIPNALPRLCPIMLMSPNSVSQYLERKSDLFDVVIFDEASQLPGCKAVGALIRAKDAVIVGDPKQMPPTSFFAGGGPIVDDLALDDLDSILDDALALGIPSKYLSWHYRSTHESLIAFSNHEFYENRMFTFPSANDRESHVSLIHVDSTYSKGVNKKEAEAIVAEIIRRYRDPELKKLSIGVVTFNSKQQDFVYNLLAKQYAQDPEFDAWGNGGEDPVFIKNLENVQGDERDVILFSIGYGPDEKGHISMNFGPINRSGGGKRLNVAFSRARVEMMIFTALSSAQIKITDASPEGLIAFRDFLKFAEGNGFEANSDAKQIASSAHEGISDAICAALTAEEYECQTHIGHSDFQIDIAIVDPYHPSQYLMGIMLDGKQYRDTQNTRDREVSQSSVLSHLGWELQRIWTIDWWDDSHRQIRRLINRLNELKETARVAWEEEQARQKEVMETDESDEQLRAALEQQASEVLEEQNEEEKPTELPILTQPAESSDTAPASETSDVQKTDEEPVQHDNTAPEPVADVQPLSDPQAEPLPEVNSDRVVIPLLPDRSMKVGQFIRTAMENLSKAGYEFTDKEMANMCSDGWMHDVVGMTRRLPFFKLYDENEKNGYLIDGVPRFYNSTLQFGKYTVYLTSQLYAKDKEPFIRWYEGLGKQTSDQISNEGLEIEQTLSPTEEPETPVEQRQVASNENNGTESSIIVVPYENALLDNIQISVDEFCMMTHRKEIAERVELILTMEAPVEKGRLIRLLVASCGVTKSGRTTETVDKILKTLGVKNTKNQGHIFCWRSEQDPDTYTLVRENSARLADELPPQEIRNALCLILQRNGSMACNDLIMAASRLFGYKKLGKNLQAALVNGLSFAKKSGDVVVNGDIIMVPRNQTRVEAEKVNMV